MGTYLITWQRPSKDANGDAVKNLKVWKVIETSPESNGDEHTVVGSFVQKSQTGWNLQYTFDESLCARVVTNEVQFFQSDNLSKVWNKLRVEGVSDFALSPGKNNSIAVFIPERKVGFLFFRFDRASFTKIYSRLTWFFASRVNQQRSRCSTCLSSERPSPRRAFSRVTRSSSSGTAMERLCWCLRRPRSIAAARVTTEKQLCTCLAPMVALIRVWTLVSLSGVS